MNYFEINNGDIVVLKEREADDEGDPVEITFQVLILLLWLLWLFLPSFLINNNFKCL